MDLSILKDSKGEISTVYRRIDNMMTIYRTKLKHKLLETKPDENQSWGYSWAKVEFKLTHGASQRVHVF